MAKIVSKSSRVQDIRIQPAASHDSCLFGVKQEEAGSSLRYLTDLHGVRKAIVDERGLLCGHNLRNPREPPEGGCVKETILITLKRCPKPLLIHSAVVTFRP